MSAALMIQKAIRSRLVGTSAVTDLVPASNILDRHERPAPSPSIIIGESQSVDVGDMDRRQQQVFHDLHIWKKEAALTGANSILGAVRDAIHAARFELDGFHCMDNFVSQSRVLRDPDGETSHGIVTISTLVFEVAS